MEPGRCGGVTWAGAYAIHQASTRIHNRRIDGREIPHALRRGWNRGRERFASSQPEAFPTCEPECPLARARIAEWQRTAHFSSKLVLHPLRPSFSGRIQEIVVGVEYTIPQILIDLTVQPARSSLRREIDYSTSEPTPLRAQVTGLYLEFLNRVLCRNQHWQVDVANVQRLAVEIFGTLISERSIHLVISPAKWIDSDRRTRGTALGDH